MKCSHCKRDLPDEWFSLTKNCRGRCYWCKRCKRIYDLMRFYRSRLVRDLGKVENWKRKILELSQQFEQARGGNAPGGKAVSASSSTPTRAGQPMERPKHEEGSKNPGAPGMVE